MWAGSALFSLEMMLFVLIYLEPERHVHNRPQLEDLVKDVLMLGNFVRDSSTYEAGQVAELETKITDAANRAFLHLKLHGVTVFNINPVCIFLFYSIFIVFSPFLASLDLIPFILVQAVICIINAAFLYLWLRIKFGIPPRKVSQEWRRLFYEFKIIVYEVNQLKSSPPSSSPSPSMALASLRQILGSIIILNDDDSGYLKSLQEKVTFLLENNVTSAYNLNLSLEAKMRDAVYKAKIALVEFRLPRRSDRIFDWRLFFTSQAVLVIISITVLFFIVFRLIYFMGVRAYVSTIPYYLHITWPEVMPTRLEMLGQICISFAIYICSFVIVVAFLPVRYYYEAAENKELGHVVDDFDIIVRDVIKDECGEVDDLPTADAASSRRDSRGTGQGKDVVVGLESDMEEIKARLFQETSKLELISIVGMGGIGKTTLARQLYHDPDIASWFDVRAWTVVSQGNTLRHVLLSLLDSARKLTDEKRQDSDDKLGVHLHQYLSYRRYLIVVDDVWDAKIWDFLSRHLPDNCKNSRVLFTSRMPNVVSRLDSSSRLHHMQCLDENHSWDLLCRGVFGAEGCPMELESTGRKIAQRCGGLPLAIVVIGGILYKHIQVDVWRDVAEKLRNSQLQDIKEKCLDILGLSYHHLPHHLRPWFLSTGVFLLAHSEIPISKIIHLWIAEEFPSGYMERITEDVAEGYIRDLIERNLISVSKWSCDGKIRTCSMHDLLRDFCVRNARAEKFRHVVKSGGYVIARGGPDESPLSLSIDPDAVRVDDINGYLDSVNLRVVNVLGVEFRKFPRRITQLVSLKYLALHCKGSFSLPPSIYKLKFLETLILQHSSFGKYSFFLPSSIWKMRKLRHIYVKPGCYMLKRLGHQFFYSLLPNLQTLVGIRNFKWTRDVIESLPNLKKLGILYDFSSSANWSTFRLENLVHIKKLEGLKINVKYDDLGSAMSHDPQELAFPPKLKKLSLSGCKIPWESMTDIGALPNLEALKLRCDAFSGPEWVTVEGEFPRLVYLLLEEMSFTTWETEGSHFPHLQLLVLRSCVMLEEIPWSIGDILTLELIQLVDCHDSAVASAREIQEEQERMGNEDLKLHVEQRSRDVDGMNFGNSEARGVGPGFFEVLYDAMYTAELEVQLGVVGMMCFLLLVLGLVFVSLFNSISRMEMIRLLQEIPWEGVGTG